MSVISVGGQRYAANLHWLERAGGRDSARTGEWLRRHWFVHNGNHTGFAARDAGGCPDGLPALSLALMSLIGGGRWAALVEGAPTGGGTLYALVKARDGAVLADGEEIFSDRAPERGLRDRGARRGRARRGGFAGGGCDRAGAAPTRPGSLLAEAQGCGGRVWEAHGRAIVGCALEAIRTNAEVDCPLVVRRP